ncbi:2,4-dichlorophenol 6-monooxygenase [Colletotrichum abscissum]|uniref:2,4-dichlorophenol 6-monooxygenase n=1 Tax=Colletotrichum abscissum TaxID=1671311 RepID=A0A9P9XST9_9PEZI|nr:2,4-dichlorophenol 6-monooxygenase [Colletotrichum abscissum]KAI3559469.1 2,4-dichlorophenol 6-monooxygenase [Colletotrichum abscissum]KAK1525475.1 2,4-dichlorophenol 6-monooxygenase [Colletotrichum abscissum]
MTISETVASTTASGSHGPAPVPPKADTQSHEGSSDSAALETDMLIIGAGPAGASLACFLASYGLKGIMISASPSTADTPRAHITNMAALECLRDIGLDRELQAIATQGHCMQHTRWCYSMAGEEFARIPSWGSDPRRKGDYELASPCDPVDIPQTALEPILVRYAAHHGFVVRFNTKLVTWNRESSPEGRYLATVWDMVSKTHYSIRTKYIFGADGARSLVAKTLQLPLVAKPGGGLAINVLVKADLSHLMDHRKGNLHWLMQPGVDHPSFGWMGIARMVKPWFEWMFILFPDKDFDPSAEVTEEAYKKRVKEFIGDDTEVEVLSVSKWFVNDIVAERYSEGNIFCLGDAVHRHPPMNGLGSNTCIQDAFNLAWKIAHVEKGHAGAALLETYSVERQPVGLGIVARANEAFRDHYAVWQSLGMLEKTAEERAAVFAQLSHTTREGREKRRAFREAIGRTAHEFHGLGVEMNQVYSGPAIYAEDEDGPYAPSTQEAEDPVAYYGPGTYPGRRIPHVWLNRAVPKEPVSTIDLAGKGGFTIFTGPGGSLWREAAAAVSAKLGCEIRVYSIGFRQDWEDVYYEWERVQGVEESGIVLVRPDRFVAWRQSEVSADLDSCFQKLLLVMKTVLLRVDE